MLSSLAVAAAERFVPARRSHDWTFHAVDRRVHPAARSAWRGSPRRHTHDSAIAPQSPVQSRPAVDRFTPRRNSLHPHGRSGRIATPAAGLGEQWMAQCRVPWVCRLHGNSDVPKKSRAMYRSRARRADRADVRGGRSMAVSSRSSQTRCSSEASLLGKGRKARESLL